MYGTLLLTDQYGAQHLFFEADLRFPWNDVGGLYAFVTWFVITGRKDVLYIGECSSYLRRPMPPSHERWAEARRLGANSVFWRSMNDAGQRKLVERNLIAAYDPPLNQQHRQFGTR